MIWPLPVMPPTPAGLLLRPAPPATPPVLVPVLGQDAIGLLSSAPLLEINQVLCNHSAGGHEITLTGGGGPDWGLKT